MKPLKSTLTHMKDLANDCSNMEWQQEYESVGEGQGFQAQLLPGVKPNSDFPELLQTGVQKVEFVDTSTWGMNYRKCMIKFAQCKEERDPKDFDAFVTKFVAQK